MSARISTEQAFEVIAEARASGNHWAIAQALWFAAAVAQANAAHPFSDWTEEEENDIFLLGGNADLVAALGHQCATSWLP